MQCSWCDCVKSTMALQLYHLSLLLTFVFALCQSDCPNGFIQVHNCKRCYHFSSEKLPWRDAYFKCNNMNSSLAVLSSKEQNAKMQEYLLAKHLVPSEWWLGGNYDWEQDTWKWAASGRVIKNSQIRKKRGKHLNWHCIILDPSRRYRWDSKKCTEKYNYICQKKVNDLKCNNDMPEIISMDANSIENSIHIKQRQNQAAYKPIHVIRDPSKPKAICPKHYKHIKGKCYKFSREALTWQDAYYTCDSEYNATLALIPGKNQDLAIRRASLRLHIGDEERWIGGIYDWEQMAWKWAVNGGIIQHQAHDRERLRWNCLVWNPKIHNKWSSDNCLARKVFICETKPTYIKLSKHNSNQIKPAYTVTMNITYHPPANSIRN
ncbi:PREDICTED: lymphocyte antigen 75-like isoform X2 [Nicrophorus vespilloides]|uniref:Lymphocyte antigen 75-like isoform X2 n=1 Tax=Nicrophorus vespilloides TaxID=110193 RepID=A0ABM1M425_NICVS|nr:PREDICTED: lymphocyte antigen 75-like isoform X2 [Nicrophorus vespilloides]